MEQLDIQAVFFEKTFFMSYPDTALVTGYGRPVEPHLHLSARD